MSLKHMCDMISKIKNACMVGKDFVLVKSSKIAIAVLKVFKDDGYIKDYEPQDREVCVHLKYHGGRSVIKYIKAISTPRKPVYKKLKDIHQIAKKFSTTVISTNKGVVAHQEALYNKVGGKLICEVSA